MQVGFDVVRKRFADVIGDRYGEDTLAEGWVFIREPCMRHGLFGDFRQKALYEGLER